MVTILAPDSSDWTPKFQQVPSLLKVYDDISGDRLEISTTVRNSIKIFSGSKVDDSIDCSLGETIFPLNIEQKVELDCRLTSFSLVGGQYESYVTIALVSRSSKPFTIDYSEDRLLHITLTLSSSSIWTSTFGALVMIDDATSATPVILGPTNFQIPEDAGASNDFLNLYIFDADLKANSGKACRITFDCDQLDNEGDNLEVKVSSSGSITARTCEVRAFETSKSDAYSCDEFRYSRYNIKVSKQPMNEEEVKLSLYCEKDGIPIQIGQYQPLFEPIDKELCRVSSSNDNEVATSVSQFDYFFVEDPTGTFAADPKTGAIYIQQPIVALNGNSTIYFPIVVHIFNGRFWKKRTSEIVVENLGFSLPKIEDLFLIVPKPTKLDDRLLNIPIENLEVSADTPIASFTLVRRKTFQLQMINCFYFRVN